MTFLFSSNSVAMLATKTLRDCGVQARMLPAPRGAATGANLCLAVDDAAEGAARAAFAAANVAATALAGGAA